MSLSKHEIREAVATIEVAYQAAWEVFIAAVKVKEEAMKKIQSDCPHERRIRYSDGFGGFMNLCSDCQKYMPEKRL